MFPVSLYYPFLIAPSVFSNVSSVSVMSILDCPFGFHQRLLTINLTKIFNGKSHHEKPFFFTDFCYSIAFKKVYTVSPIVAPTGVDIQILHVY